MAKYDGPVVDAHHHYWEPSLGYQPWLRPGVIIPFRYGDYTAAKVDYLPPDMARDAEQAGIDLVYSVTMETEWAEDDLLSEIVYMEEMKTRFDGRFASIGRVLLNSPSVEEDLDAMCEHDIVRGIRHKPGESSSWRTKVRGETLLSDPSWRGGFAALEGRNITFELQTAWWHFDDALDLFRHHPEIPVVINHSGLPADRSDEGLAGWRQAIGDIAKLPNVSMKISGIGLPGVPWTVTNNRVIVESIVDGFGVERVMFASNFPVDGLTGSYTEIYGGFLEITEGWSPDEQLAAFAGNAVRTYRLPAREILGNLV